MNNYDIWFTIAPISPINKISLLNKYKDTKNIWYYINNDYNYEKNKGSIKVCKILKNSWDILEFDKFKKILEEKNINFITINDKLYPEKLRVYDDAPFSLFYKGDINKLNFNKSVAIVGSRKCSAYGINVTKIVSKTLSENNINIISGLARGIDSIAHKSCLESNSYTCGILGCGIDIVYPRENYKLYDKVIEKGCIISEFLPGTPPFAYNFPIRNRIISALSDIVIIIEANEKSGSLITARTALDQGKDVMAVPGSIFSDQSKGTNRLIKDGAYPLTNIEDISDILDVDLKYKNTTTKNNMSANEKKIYDKLTNSPMHIDEIIRITNIDIECLYELLFEMQLKDEIISLPGNYYAKLNNKI